METKKAMNPEKIQAWHFVGKTLRDGSPIPRNGKWLKFDGEVKICDTGLHASLHPLDALQYAPGSTLCLVECRDIIEWHDDKFVCTERRIIERMDSTELLRYFARQCALSVIHLYPNGTDDVLFDYLMTGDEPRAAANAAANAANAANATEHEAVYAAYAAEHAAYAAEHAVYAEAYATAATARATAYAANATAHATEYGSVLTISTLIYAAARDKFRELVHDCFADYL